MNIEVGEKLFEFRSKQDWINRAQRIWKMHEVRSQNTVCIDKKGRICGWGEHFATAERDDAYPIEVFRLRQDMTPNAALSATPRKQRSLLLRVRTKQSQRHRRCNASAGF